MPTNKQIDQRYEDLPFMTPLASLILFCALAATALVSVSLMNDREQRRHIVQRKLRQLKLRIQELEELTLEIDQLVESRAVARLVNDEILEIISTLKASNKATGHLDTNYRMAIARSDTLSDESSHHQLDRLKDSDAQIARSQKAVEGAAVVIRRQQASGNISLDELNIFIGELSWAHLMINIISQIGQGHRALNRNDSLSAHAFYKKAQHLLMQSSHTDKRRHRMIKELSEILSGKRRLISEDLMPEVQYNPSPDQSIKTDTKPKANIVPKKDPVDSQ